jgi:membrane associated rhomboid family serine protease
VNAIWALLGANVLIHLALLPSVGMKNGGRLPAKLLLQVGGNYPPLTRRGQWWRLYTSMFLHTGFEHLGMNAVALWQIGRILSPVLPEGKMLACYVVGGLGGSIVSTLYRLGARVPAGDLIVRSSVWRYYLGTTRRVVVSVGASGAICGLIGTAFAIGFHTGGTAGTALWQAMLQWMGMALVYGMAPGIDNAAHLGGMVAGAGIGWVIAPGTPDIPVVILGGVAVLALVGGFGMAWRTRAAETVDEIVNRGVELAKAGKDAEAVVEYRRAIELHAGFAIVHYDLALALQRLGDLPGAAAAARAAAAIDPGWPKAQALVDELGG